MAKEFWYLMKYSTTATPPAAISKSVADTLEKSNAMETNGVSPIRFLRGGTIRNVADAGTTSFNLHPDSIPQLVKEYKTLPGECSFFVYEPAGYDTARKWNSRAEVNTFLDPAIKPADPIEKEKFEKWAVGNFVIVTSLKLS